MQTSELIRSVEEVEPRLLSEVFVRALTFDCNGRKLHVALTERLRKRARKGRVWKSRGFLTALRNTAYGFDATRARSRGGQDGVFLLDRSFAPRNEMIRKIFDAYLDRPDSGAAEVADRLGVPRESLLAARVVSHHMRLLGVLAIGRDEDWLVLVDYDDTK